MSKQHVGHRISGNAKVVRRINRSVILNLIREHQPISRAAISKLTKLNKGTVSSIVAELLAENFVDEELVADSNVGRNPLLLRLKRGAHFVGAIDIDVGATAIGVADIDGNMIETATLETQPEEAERFIVQCIERLAGLRAALNINHLEGVGVSIAGLVDPAKGLVFISPNLGWKELEVARIFNQHCRDDGPAFYGNDANASALAELWFGDNTQNLSNFVFISEGIGAGIVIGKKLIEGSFYAAGEFGHMTIIESGDACPCGNSGCWEVYASNKSTVSRYNRRRRQDPSDSIATQLRQIIAQAKAGEPDAIDTLRETGRYLGMGVANIIKALDPDTIVFGGRIVQAWEIIYPEIVREVSRRVFFGIKKNTQILPTSLKIRSSLIGAATLAIKEIFSGLQITS